MRRETRLLQAITLADQLIHVTDKLPDADAHALALRLRYRLKPAMPIEDIIARIPGATLADRARAAGVSRQVLFNLLQGTRPSEAIAEKLAQASGVPAKIIRARAEKPLRTQARAAE